MMTLFRLLSMLPLWALHGIGWVLGWVVFLASPTYRRRFLDHARLAGYAWAQWHVAVGQAGMLVAELPRLWLGQDVPIKWKGRSYIEEALATGKGIIFLTPHLGCFEVTAQAYAQAFGHQNPMTVLFRPARQAWLRSLVDASRGRPGLFTAATSLAGVKQLVKALRQGQSVGLLPDQVPPQGLGVWAPFFGRPAYTMTLSARLIQLSGAAVLLAWGERLPWGRGYCIHVRPFDGELTQDPQLAAARINESMAQLIDSCPQQYLWGYARYKQPRGER